MPPWLETAWEFFKVVAPWLTGGLAGATLTYLLNQRIARRKQARLLLTTERVDYSLATRDDQLRELRVSYRGSEFDNLLFYQISISNVSGKTITKTPFLLRFAAETRIVDQVSMTYPLSRTTAFDRQSGHDCAYLWDAGELKPRDSARLKLLLAPTTAVEWNWRGDDEVDVTGYGREAAQTVERELRTIIVWIALYILLGSVPLLSGAAHAAMVLVSLPFIVSYCMRWWPLITKRDSQSLNIVTGSESNVSVVMGSGSALIPTQPGGKQLELPHDDAASPRDTT